VVAGLGNIYVSEALFRAKLAPDRPAGQLSSVEAGRLCRAIREVLGAAIAAGGSSISDYVQADGELGSFQDQFQVYDRGDSACPRRGCRGQIVRIVQSGRATFYCPHCQQ
jgi:formamidopyrimidine-DNA glycosylase